MSNDDDWLLWCRLCAKIQKKAHIDIFFKNEEKQNLVKILEQYFLLDISTEDKMPKTVCEKCYCYMQTHIRFMESVSKAQEMFSDLISYGYVDKVELFEIRQKYSFETKGLIEEPDVKVGFIDINPLVHCDVMAENNGGGTPDDKEDGEAQERNPLDEPTLSTELQNLFKEDIDDDDGDEDHHDFDDYTADGDDQEIKEELEALEREEKIDQDTDISNCSKPRRRKKASQKQINYKEDEEKVDDDDDEDYEIDKEDDDGEDDRKPVKKRKVRKDKMLQKVDCPECSYQTWRNNDLKWHMISKHGKPVDESHKFICSQCSKAFRNQHFLKRHIETHLPADQKQAWPCPHCDKTFSSSNNAKIHVKHIHFNNNQFICEECGFIAKTTGSLKQHLESHLPVAKYECKICGQRIRSKYRLKVHMDTHNPDKFPCKICNLKFSSRMTLKNHSVIHSDVMPHKCDSCGRGFKLSKYLKSHLLTHTGVKHYSCKFCDRQFAHSANCRLHMKKEHPEQLALLDAEGGPKNPTGSVPTLQALRAFARTVPNGTSDDEIPLSML